MGAPGRQTPLLPVRSRGAFLALATAGAALLVGVGVHYAGRPTAGALDSKVDNWVMSRFQGHERAAVFLADLGSTVPVVLATLLLVVLQLRGGSRRGAVLAGMAPLLATTLTEFVLKPAFGRQHYPLWDPGYSYPSGHAAAAFTLVFVASVLARRRLEPRAGRGVQISVVAGCLLVGLVVAVGLVGAGYHYATDTLGGGALALAIVFGLSLAIDRAASFRPFAGSGIRPTVEPSRSDL